MISLLRLADLVLPPRAYHVVRPPGLSLQARGRVIATVPSSEIDFARPELARKPVELHLLSFLPPPHTSIRATSMNTQRCGL